MRTALIPQLSSTRPPSTSGCHQESQAVPGRPAAYALHPRYLPLRVGPRAERPRPGNARTQSGPGLRARDRLPSAPIFHGSLTRARVPGRPLDPAASPARAGAAAPPGPAPPRPHLAEVAPPFRPPFRVGRPPTSGGQVRALPNDPLRLRSAGGGGCGWRRRPQAGHGGAGPRAPRSPGPRSSSCFPPSCGRRPRQVRRRRRHGRRGLRWAGSLDWLFLCHVRLGRDALTHGYWPQGFVSKDAVRRTLRPHGEAGGRGQE